MLEYGQHHNKQAEHNSLCLADALPLGSGAGIEGIINVVSQHHGLLGRFAAGQGQVLVKQLEGVGQSQEGADGNAGHNHGDLDLKQDLLGVCAIDLGGFDQIQRHVLQASNVDDHHVTDLLPAHQNDKAQEAVRGVQGKQRFFECAEYAVEQNLPDIAKDNAADQVGHKEGGTEDVGTADAAGKQQRNAERQHIDEHRGHHSKHRSEPERMGEGIIQPDLGIVAETNKGNILNSCEFAERKRHAPDKRPDKADDKGQQGGQHEHRPIALDRFFHNSTPLSTYLST